MRKRKPDKLRRLLSPGFSVCMCVSVCVVCVVNRLRRRRQLADADLVVHVTLATAARMPIHTLCRCEGEFTSVGVGHSPTDTVDTDF